MEHFPKVVASILTGEELITIAQQPTGFKLLDFWRWSVSDMLSNATRGRFAEFIVASAANVDMNTVRDEWQAFDLITREGIKIEVKSAAYLQSWYQKKLSVISFSTKLARHWDSETNLLSETAKRHADVYVMCLLNHKDKRTVDPLNMSQWSFYVLATRVLNDYTRSQHSITLASLEKLTKPVCYKDLNKEIIFKAKINNGESSSNQSNTVDLK